MMTWQERAAELKPSNTWSDTSRIVRQEYFPNDDGEAVYSRVRAYLRRYFKVMNPVELKSDSSTFEQRADGTAISDRIIAIAEGDIVTPESILKAHNLDVGEWMVVSYRNNYWHSQVKGGQRMVMYQSRLTAKPIVDGISHKHIKELFTNKVFIHPRPLSNPYQYDPTGEVLEIDIPDPHSGLLAWHQETGEDYDLKIVRERFDNCMADIVTRMRGRLYRKIIFALLGDVMHIDNDKQETTKGTFQQSDGRMAKIFDNTLDMLIDGIERIAKIAPVQVFSVSGNHDRTSSYMLLRTVETWFKNDPDISFNISPDPLKFSLEGDNLIGWAHGDISARNMRGWLQQHARKEFGLSKRAEIHAGHIHTEKTKEIIQTDDDEGITVRYLPAICSASYWEHQQAYGVKEKTVVSFVWHDTIGLREMWHSNT